jgi:peptide-methionine (R)-S-oxide reductase
MELSDAEWKKELTPQQYYILREKGTERPFSGTLLPEDREGNFVCAGCGTVLFSHEARYESDINSLKGWPNFSAAVRNNVVRLQDDNTLGMHRTEVICANCGGHLGHLFDDSSSPSGKHYCINSAALSFRKVNTD